MIVRHFPSRALFDSSVDRAFEQLTNSFFENRRSAGPTVDGAWHDDEYVITVDLPGVPADGVSVDITGDVLAIQANTDSMQWQRTLRLGGRLDPDKVQAHHVDGRLTVRIGTYAEPEARRVQISTTPPPAAINATADTTEAVEAEATEA